MTPNTTPHLIDHIKSWIKQEFDSDQQVYCPSFQLEEKKPQEEKKAAPSVEKQKLLTLDISPEIESAEILLVTSSTKSEDQALLSRMTAAVSKNISKAFFVSIPAKRESGWFEALFHLAKKARWVLLSEMELYQLPDLMLHYQKLPKRKVFNIPLFFLADLSAYQKSVELKRSLWNTLLSEL